MTSPSQPRTRVRVQIDLLAAVLPTVARNEARFPEFVEDAFRGGGLNASEYERKFKEREQDKTELGLEWALAEAPLCHSPMYITEPGMFPSWVEYWKAPEPISKLLVPATAYAVFEPDLKPGHIRVMFSSLIWIHLIAAFLCFRLILRRFVGHKATKAPDVDRPMEITIGQEKDERGERMVERMWTFGVVGVAGLVLNLVAIPYFSLAYLPYISHSPSDLQPSFFNLVWQPIYQTASVFYYASILVALLYRWSASVENYLRAVLVVAVFTSFYLKIGDVVALGFHFLVLVVSLFREGLARFLGHLIHTRASTATYILMFTAATMFELFAPAFAAICFGLPEDLNTPMAYQSLLRMLATWLLYRYSEDRYVECQEAEGELRKMIRAVETGSGKKEE